MDEFKKESPKNYLPLTKKYFITKEHSLKNINFETNSIVELTYGIIHEFDLFQTNESQDYILKLLDIINEFSLMQSDTLTEFLSFFEENKSNLCIASPDDQNAITITSIHKSKGLEYPIVILPFASWTHQASSEEIWFDFENEIPSQELFVENKGYLDKFYFKVKNKIFDESEKLRIQKNAEIDAIFLDSLNMLYVATTRPKQKLHILLTQVSDEIKTSTKTFFLNSIASILYDFIKENAIESPIGKDFESIHPSDTQLYTMEQNKEIVNCSQDESVLKSKLISLEVELSETPNLRVVSSKKELFNKASNKRKKGELAH